MSQIIVYGGGGGGGGGIVTIDGDVGSVTGTTITLTGGSSGAVFTGVGTVMTESFNFLALPNSTVGGTAGYISFGGDPYIQNFGTFNTFIGVSSGNFTTAGIGNVGLGYLSLNAITTGQFNVALGVGAMEMIASGVNNVAIGTTAMQNGNDYSNSVGIGYQALQAIAAADDNIGIGAMAMLVNVDSPSNIAIGTRAIPAMTTGTGLNIGIGNSVLEDLTSGQSNIAIGNLAGSDYGTTESSNIVIGNIGVTTDNNTIRIGTAGAGVGEQNRCFIAGIVGVTTSNSEMVTIDSTTGELGVATIPSVSVVPYTAVNNGLSPYTVLLTDYFLGVDVTGGAVTILLPDAPATGSVWIVKDVAGLASGTNITVTTVSGAVNIDGATTFVMNTNYEAANFIFSGSTYEVF